MSHAPAAGTQLGEQLVQAVRRSHPGGLHEGRGRKWINHPLNFFGITIQPRDASLVVHVKLNPNEVGVTSLNIVRDWSSYSRFKLITPDQLADATAVALQAARRSQFTLDDL